MDRGQPLSEQPMVHRMDRGTHDVEDVGEYEGYVIRADHAPEHGMSSTVRESLDEFNETFSRILGPNHVYVRPLNREDNKDIIENVRQNVLDEALRDGEAEYSEFDGTLPWLIATDKHPNNLSPEDQCVILELGKLDSDTEVERTLRNVAKFVQSREYERLSWETRIERIRSKTPDGLTVVGTIASAIGLA